MDNNMIKRASRLQGIAKSAGIADKLTSTPAIAAGVTGLVSTPLAYLLAKKLGLNNGAALGAAGLAGAGLGAGAYYGANALAGDNGEGGIDWARLGITGGAGLGGAGALGAGGFFGAKALQKRLNRPALPGPAGKAPSTRFQKAKYKTVSGARGAGKWATKKPGIAAALLGLFGAGAGAGAAEAAQ